MSKQGESSIRRAVLGVMGLLALALAAATGTEAAPIDRVGTYEEFVSRGCARAASCTATFTAIPRGKTFVLTQVSCQISLTGDATVTGARIDGSNRFSFMVPQLVAPRILVADFSTRKVFAAGQIPKIYVTVTPAVGMLLECSIGGGAA